jgi:predicted permease
VMAEVALAFILLVGAGLMVGTLQRLMAVKLGYDPHHVSMGEIALEQDAYSHNARVASFYERVLGLLSENRQVEAAAVMSSQGEAQAISIEGRAPIRPAEPKPEVVVASSEFLRVMRIPLVGGRWLAAADGPMTKPVAVVSRSWARYYWPHTSPLGMRVRLSNDESNWLTIVGIAEDTKDWFRGEPVPRVYLSFRQSPQRSMSVLARGSGHLGNVLRATTQRIDAQQPLFHVRTLEQQMLEETSGIRNAARMMEVYAGVSLLLAITGIYSICAFFVSQRMREIGVRVSLGASRRGIITMVLAQSCRAAGLGLLIGLPLAIVLSLGMSHALFDLVVLKPTTFLFYMVVMALAAIMAAVIPAYRASRVDPLTALRQD